MTNEFHCKACGGSLTTNELCWNPACRLAGVQQRPIHSQEASAFQSSDSIRETSTDIIKRIRKQQDEFMQTQLLLYDVRVIGVERHTKDRHIFKTSREISDEELRLLERLLNYAIQAYLTPAPADATDLRPASLRAEAHGGLTPEQSTAPTITAEDTMTRISRILRNLFNTYPHNSDDYFIGATNHIASAFPSQLGRQRDKVSEFVKEHTGFTIYEHWERLKRLNRKD